HPNIRVRAVPDLCPRGYFWGAEWAILAPGWHAILRSECAVSGDLPCPDRRTSIMVRSSRQTLSVIVLFLTSCGFLGVLFAQRNPAVAPGSDSDVRESLKQFTEVYSVVEQNYAEPVNADKAIYNGAIPGMLH